MKPCNETEIVGLDATYRKYYLKGYEAAEKEHNYHLKKIRAEIEEHVKINQNLNVDRAKALCWCLDVIDKYSGESEGSENDDRWSDK